MPKWKVLVAGAVAVATFASPGQAQAVNYFTQGFFTSPVFAPCNQLAPLPGAGPQGASCSAGGFTLTYIPTTGVNIGNGSIASLGQFSLIGTGNATAMPGNLNFELFINQTTPTPGVGIFLGAITGTVSTSPTAGNTSSLKFTPNQSITVGATSYQIIFDQIGPAANIGLGIPINNVRGIEALVTTSATTTTPEPASMILLGTGLVGVIGAARRRKSAQA